MTIADKLRQTCGTVEAACQLIEEMTRRIEQLESDRTDAMSVVWSVEEWMHGNITDDELRQTATDVLNRWVCD